MAAHHYVSKFHLRELCDPESLRTPDPWLWVGDLADSSVKRRAPKNVGTAPDLYDGPGGLAEPEATVEAFLAKNVEGPASQALRKVISHVNSELKELPPELMRYLAWAASRSLPMQRLEVQWSKRFGALLDAPLAESPPEGLADAVDRIRPVQLLHPTLGEITIAAGQDLSLLLDAGWIPDPREQSNFLEGVHIQPIISRYAGFLGCAGSRSDRRRVNFSLLATGPSAGVYLIVSMPRHFVCGIHRPFSSLRFHGASR